MKQGSNGYLADREALDQLEFLGILCFEVVGGVMNQEERDRID